MSKIYNPFTDETIEFGKSVTDLNGPVRRIARQHRGKIGVAAGAGAASAFDRASGGHNNRVGNRRYMGDKRNNSTIDSAIMGDKKAAGKWDRGAANHARDYANERSQRSLSKRLIPADPASGTGVRSVKPILPGGSHVSHENDLYSHGRRRVTPHGDTAVRRYRGKGSKPAEGGQPIRKRDSSQQGAAVRGSRGTPMSGIAQAGRVGHRLTIS